MSSRRPKTDFLLLASCSAALLVAGAPSAAGQAVPCLGSESRPLIDRTLTIGAATQSVALPTSKDSDLSVQIVEDGIDVEASAQDGQGHETAAADFPVSRQGIQRLVFAMPVRDAAVTVRSIDQARHVGAVRIVVTALPTDPAGCARFTREQARADGLFAAAQRAARGEGDRQKPDVEAKAVAAEHAYQLLAQSTPAQRFDAERGDAELAVAMIDYYNLSRWDDCVHWAGAAADSMAKAGRDYLRARARSVQAAAWLEKPDSAGAFARARDVFDELAAFHRARGESYDEALQVNLAGVGFFNEAKFEPAIAKYAEARATFARLGETQRAALAVQNIALCEWGLGRMRRALAQFEQALKEMDPAQRPSLYLLTLNNAALASQAAGDFDKSMHLLEEALRRSTDLDDKYYLARSLFGIGVTYYGIGERDLARQFLLEALRTWNQHDERGRLSALRTLANIEAESGHLDEADRYNTEALTLAHSGTASDRVTLKLAETELARGHLAAAAKIIDPLSGERPHAQRMTQAEARFVRARLRIRQGRLSDAEADLRAAIPVFRELESLSEEFQARVELARLLRDSGRSALALREIGAALDCSEELRAQTVNPEYRASVAAAIRPALDLRLELLRESYEALVRGGDTAGAQRVAIDALSMADASRGRAFEQYRALKLDNPDPQLVALLGERAELLHDVADRRFYLDTREDRAGADDARAQVLREDIRRLRVSLGVADARIAELARVTNAAPAQSFPSILQRFGVSAETAAVEYWIGSRASFAWVIAGTRVSWIRIADGPQVTSAARRFHDSLSNFVTVARRERIAAAERLDELVIAPVNAALAGRRRWVVVPDGPLHFVPFAALKERGANGRFLVERVALAMTPALRYATAGGAQAPAQPGGRVLLVSDPIYQASDPRLAGFQPVTRQFVRAVPLWRGGRMPDGLPRLPATALEADGIRALFPDPAVDDLRGAQATRAAFLNRDLGQYRYVHVAAHGVMDAEIPAMSALELGAFDEYGRVDDQEIRAGDLLATRLNADLVVLSACETSLGPSYPDEGPMGLRYAVLARGARAVVASLWMTADELNAELMTDLYAGILRGGEPVDLALTDAMRKMLVRRPKLDPALWAAYSVYVVKN